MLTSDVRNGPLGLHVPDTQDRYYVLQFVDAWTNNFAYIGRRATGADEAIYLLASQGYQGEDPEGMKAVHPPTGVSAILGRMAVNGAADLPAVHALQDRFTLTPLNVYQGGTLPAAASGVPESDPGVGEDLKMKTTTTQWHSNAYNIFILVLTVLSLGIIGALPSILSSMLVATPPSPQSKKRPSRHQLLRLKRTLRPSSFRL